MLNLLKPIPIYLKVSTDRMEMTRLDTGETVIRESKEAEDKFSNQRLVVADFYNAEFMARSMMKELLKTNMFFQRQLSIVIQQTEKREGGLSMVEQRVLYDLGERCGGRYVFLVDQDEELTVQEALTVLADQ
jgi:hypothetical protein